MARSSDIIIIGAGIIGLCSALQLSRSVSASITVLDQGAAAGSGSSGASSAICRHLYTYDEMIRLARDGIEAYRQWPEFLGLSTPRAKLANIGVLWIGDQAASTNADRLRRHGIAASLLTAEDLRERFPALSPCGLAPDFETGEDHQCVPAEYFLFEDGGGYMDAQGALDDLTEVLRKRGVRIEFKQRVERIETDGERVRGVALDSGEVIESPQVLNASGPWCNRLLAPLGLAEDWPLEPTRIQVLHLPRPAELAGPLPVCGDFTSGVYFRPQGDSQLIVGSTLDEDEREHIEDPDTFDPLPDETFRQVKLHALHHRLPALPYRRRPGGYCGLYTINRADMHPVIGRTPVDGFFVANGFSGHGFKLGPAIGALVARTMGGGGSAFDSRVHPDFLAWGRPPLHLDTMNVLA